MAKDLMTKSQMITRIAELSEQNSNLRAELETQKQINKDCEIEYRRVVTQYNAVIEQNRQLQTELNNERGQTCIF